MVASDEWNDLRRDLRHHEFPGGQSDSHRFRLGLRVCITVPSRPNDGNALAA